MCDINLRNVDAALKSELKIEAAQQGMTLKAYCVALLSGTKCKPRNQLQAAAESFVKELEEKTALAGANNVGLMSVKWTNVEDIPERTVEYEE